MKPIRTLIADDYPVFAKGLARLVESDLQVIGFAADGEQLLDSVAALHPDLVIADVSMPKINGIEATRRIRTEHPHVLVMLLTMHNDVMYAVEALDAGAHAYLLKHSEPSEILRAIRDVLSGEIVVDPSLASSVLRAQSRSARSESRPASELTDRQREVLRALVQGRTAKEIARELSISRKTVEYHKYRMMRQLDLDSTADLVRYALTHGIGNV